MREFVFILEVASVQFVLVLGSAVGGRDLYNTIVFAVTGHIGHCRRSGKLRSHRNRVNHRIKCVFHLSTRVFRCDGNRGHLDSIACVRSCERGNAAYAGGYRHADVAAVRSRPFVAHAFSGTKVNFIGRTSTTH